MGWRKMNVEKKACRNKYDPLLSYVYFLDGIFLNTEIIKQGYGSAYTKYPFKYVEEIRRYEREARENRRMKLFQLWETHLK